MASSKASLYKEGHYTFFFFFFFFFSVVSTRPGIVPSKSVPNWTSSPTNTTNNTTFITTTSSIAITTIITTSTTHIAIAVTVTINMSSGPLFGIVPAGQQLITDPASTPSPTSFLYALPSHKPFSHIVVFMLPGIGLPDNTAAAIYLATAQDVAAAAQSGSTPNFKFLGGIGPGKESAMFKRIQALAANKTAAIPLPAPPQMSNHGNYIVSLNQFVKWLGERAEEVGVEVYPGFAASEVVYDTDGSVKGVATNDLGIGRDGKPKEAFERGMEFHARVTMFGEGCHGSLSKQVINKFDLRSESQHQTYGLGIKEVWEVDPAKFEKGLVVHSMGFPLPKDVYGGSFMYHFGENLVSLGLVVSLDYENPWLSPYQEFQKLKTHPLFRDVLEGGKCISYGARSLVEGGFQSIPKVAFPGGALIGDSAGFVNVPKVKGTHNAMKSGMLAAEAAWTALSGTTEGTVFLYDYEDALRKSSIWKELKEVRNLRPSFHTPLGLYGGLMYSGLDTFVLKGRTPWTLKHKTPDYAATKPAAQFEKIEYAKPDGKLTFDILTSVSRTGTNHEEDQPVHLQVADWDAHTDKAYPKYKGLENRFCPAGVYEYVEDESKPHGVRFQINAQNCIHCKTCDIKAPDQDINWQVPQGGEGPKYYMT
ncbi:hypothetical protein G7046_g5347 [Stylonectria norvegica]|nr:hypothetical protein G7046_g5347 [Stylonectria norvegica]